MLIAASAVLTSLSVFLDLIEVGVGREPAHGDDFGYAGFVFVGGCHQQPFRYGDQAVAVGDFESFLCIAIPVRIVWKLEIQTFLHQKLVPQSRYRHGFVGKGVAVLGAERIEQVFGVA